MSLRETILRHSAIVKRLRISTATLKEIEAYLEKEAEMQEYHFKTSARTFQRDMEDIRSCYYINIQYDKSKRKYFIDNSGSEELNSRMLDAFETFNALKVSTGMAEHLDFEKRKSAGLDNLHGFLHAIKNRLQLNFNYHSFWQDETYLRKTNPYLLKEFKSRWYLIARDLKDEAVKTYALDRITDIDITKKKYDFPSGYNPKEKFQHSFGIISSVHDSVPEKVVLSFSPYQGKYVKTLPLHHSQEILIDNEEEFRIQLKIYTAFDFVKELISFGDDLEILEPRSLRDQVSEVHRKAFKQYVTV